MGTIGEKALSIIRQNPRVDDVPILVDEIRQLLKNGKKDFQKTEEWAELVKWTLKELDCQSLEVSNLDQLGIEAMKEKAQAISAKLQNIIEQWRKLEK